MYDGDEETYLNLEVTDTLDLKDTIWTLHKTYGAGVLKTLVETLTKTDLRTLRKTLTEHLVLIFTLLTRSKSHLFTTR